MQAFQGKGKPSAVRSIVSIEEDDGEEEDEEDEGYSTEEETNSPCTSPTKSPTEFGKFKSVAPDLSPEEFDLLRQINWIRTINTYPQFRKCLLELPSLVENSFGVFSIDALLFVNAIILFFSRFKLMFRNKS